MINILISHENIVNRIKRHNINTSELAKLTKIDERNINNLMNLSSIPEDIATKMDIAVDKIIQKMAIRNIAKKKKIHSMPEHATKFYVLLKKAGMNIPQYCKKFKVNEGKLRNVLKSTNPQIETIKDVMEPAGIKVSITLRKM